MKNYYRLLRVSPTAAQQEIQARIEMLRRDPGNADGSPDDLAEAFAVLSDPEKRKLYDFQRVAQYQPSRRAVATVAFAGMILAAAIFFAIRTSLADEPTPAPTQVSQNLTATPSLTHSPTQPPAATRTATSSPTPVSTTASVAASLPTLAISQVTSGRMSGAFKVGNLEWRRSNYHLVAFGNYAEIPVEFHSASLSAETIELHFRFITDAWQSPDQCGIANKPYTEFIVDYVEFLGALGSKPAPKWEIKPEQYLSAVAYCPVPTGRPRTQSADDFMRGKNTFLKWMPHQIQFSIRLAN